MQLDVQRSSLYVSCVDLAYFEQMGDDRLWSLYVRDKSIFETEFLKLFRSSRAASVLYRAGFANFGTIVQSRYSEIASLTSINSVSIRRLESHLKAYELNFGDIDCKWSEYRNFSCKDPSFRFPWSIAPATFTPEHDRFRDLMRRVVREFERRGLKDQGPLPLQFRRSSAFASSSLK